MKLKIVFNNEYGNLLPIDLSRSGNRTFHHIFLGRIVFSIRWHPLKIWLIYCSADKEHKITNAPLVAYEIESCADVISSLVVWGGLRIYFLLRRGVRSAILPGLEKNGVNTVTFRGADTAHDYIGKLFKIVIMFLTLVVIIYALEPSFYPYLLSIVWLVNRIVRFIGLALLSLSLGWTIAAQIQMGNSWRIGIDEQKRTDLVRTGLFHYSRNPIFLKMLVTFI